MGLALALGVLPVAAFAAAPAAGPVLLLDPGHGGSDKGVQVPGFVESEFTLDLAKRLQALLLAQGLGVQLTRTDDVDLSPSARVAMADALHPIALVSLHANAAFQVSARGPRLFVPAAGPVDEPAAPLWDQASRLQASASLALGQSLARALGVVGPHGVQTLKLALFRGLDVPVCMVECEFATHPEGLKDLQDPAWRDALAHRLAAGIGAWVATRGAAHAR